jgi:hypothetical protein
MASRGGFVQNLANLNLSHLERAVALLYYYRETQEFEERTASALASDLHEEGFPKPNVSRLKTGLTRSRFTVKGNQKGSFRVDVRRLPELQQQYGNFLKTRKVEVSGNVVPTDWVAGTRTYLERIVYQINGSYEYGFYDACAALSRRLMESLIIDVYVHQKRHHEIQNNGVFIPLERLIKYVTSDAQLALGRNTPKTMTDIKQLGDTAAHDRTYITPQVDIDEIKAQYRRMIQELLEKAGVKKHIV